MSKVVVLAILLLLVACETESNEPDEAGTEVGALSVCNKFVTELLDNPLSANFKGFGGMGGDATKLPGLTPQWTLSAT